MYMYKSSFMLRNEINVLLICIKNFYTVVLFVCSSHISSTCNELLSVLKFISIISELNKEFPVISGHPTTVIRAFLSISRKP